MGDAEMLLLFVVSVTVIVSLILGSFEKKKKTCRKPVESEQISPVLGFGNKGKTVSFIDESVKKVVEKKDETESPVFEISERSNASNEREEFIDDWEGIERTELEKAFGKAVVFASNADKFDEDLELQLYGLQKVVLEGPCHEPQPMALKVSARSKWSAWDRLGNMSRDMAMEKYIEILAMAVPDWEGKAAKSIQDAEFKK